MEKKVIYMISSLFYPSIGGVENHIYNLSKTLMLNNENLFVKILKPVINLKRNNVYLIDGIEVHEISVGNDRDEEIYNNFKEKSKGNLIGFFYGYRRKSFFNRYRNEIYQYIEKEIQKEKQKFIIHQHDFISNIMLSKTLAKKYKVIFTNHTGEYLFLKKIPIINNILIKILTNHFSYIIGPSDELSDFEKIRNKKTFCYLPNGVDTERFFMVSNEQKLNLRKEMSVSGDEIIVFSPRRWAPTKGIIYLVKAIKEIMNQTDKNIKFYFAGNDYGDYKEYRQEILNYINENNLKKYIVFLGNVDYQKIDFYYKISDVVILPSLMEAVSLGALEAMSCGKIMIGTKVGGFPQIITSGENGVLIESKNEKEITEIILKVSENLARYENMGVNARKFVEVNYSWNEIARKTMEIYSEFYNEF